MKLKRLLLELLLLGSYYSVTQGGEEVVRIECQKMRSTAIPALVVAFKAATGGVDPLCIDWTRGASHKLVDDDDNVIETIEAIKSLVDSNGKGT